MWFAILLLPTPASACSCAPPSVDPFSPAFANVPTNAVIRFVGESDEVPTPALVYEDGVLRTDVVEKLEHHGSFVVLTQSTDTPFTAGATVEVRLDAESDPLITMQVTDQLDVTPPTWSEEYVVESSRTLLSLSSCGPFRGHTFEWLNLEDDLWHPEELLVVAVPHDPSHAGFVGNGAASTVAQGVCSNDDETLKGDFHRSYEIFIEDGSGNRIGPFEVDTRQCGCAGVPSSAGGMVLWFAAVVALALRRPSALGIPLLYSAALPRSAAASSIACEPSPRGILAPTNVEASYPTNTVVHIQDASPGSHVLLENGIARDDIIEKHQEIGETTLLTLSTIEPWQIGATIEVLKTDSNDPEVKFLVGSQPDTTPPTWDGAFLVESRRGYEGRLLGCVPYPGRTYAHEFQWIGIEDDHWSATELLVIADPRLPDGKSFLSDGQAGLIEQRFCASNDPSLRRTFHRVYDVFVEDGAGNRIGPFEVDTRQPEAGCASVTGASSASVLFAALSLAASGGRRRSPSCRR